MKTELNKLDGTAKVNYILNRQSMIDDIKIIKLSYKQFKPLAISQQEISELKICTAFCLMMRMQKLLQYIIDNNLLWSENFKDEMLHYIKQFDGLWESKGFDVTDDIRDFEYFTTDENLRIIKKNKIGFFV
jgi:hypothetical protein